MHSLDETLPINLGIIPNCTQDPTILDYERSNGTDGISIKDGLLLSSKYVFGQLAQNHYSGNMTYYTEGIRAWCLPESFSQDFDVEGFRVANLTNPVGCYWAESMLPSMANGGVFTMTPLDVLSFYNTIANHGTVVQPYLVESLQKGAKNIVQHEMHMLMESAMTPTVADTLAKALRYGATNSPEQHLHEAIMSVAGKTGIARQIINSYDEKDLADASYCDKDGKYKTAATFAGFFPADDPKYSIICVLYSVPCRKTYYGGTLPAQIVRDLVNRIEYE